LGAIVDEWREWHRDHLEPITTYSSRRRSARALYARQPEKKCVALHLVNAEGEGGTRVIADGDSVVVAEGPGCFYVGLAIAAAGRRAKVYTSNSALIRECQANPAVTAALAGVHVILAAGNAHIDSEHAGVFGPPSEYCEVLRSSAASTVVVMTASRLTAEDGPMAAGPSAATTGRLLVREALARGARQLILVTDYTRHLRPRGSGAGSPMFRRDEWQELVARHRGRIGIVTSPPPALRAAFAFYGPNAAEVLGRDLYDMPGPLAFGAVDYEYDRAAKQLCTLLRSEGGEQQRACVGFREAYDLVRDRSLCAFAVDAPLATFPKRSFLADIARLAETSPSALAVRCQQLGCGTLAVVVGPPTLRERVARECSALPRGTKLWQGVTGAALGRVVSVLSGGGAAETRRAVNMRNSFEAEVLSMMRARVRLARVGRVDWSRLDSSGALARFVANKVVIAPGGGILGRMAASAPAMPQVALRRPTLPAAPAPAVSAPLSPPAASEPPDLYHWLLDPFHGDSAILGTAGHGRLRDGQAMLALISRFPDEEFPFTRRQFVTPGEMDWQRDVYQRHLQAIWLVGRIGLFGREAIEHWILKNARFCFPMHERPDHCPPHGLDPEYNRIREWLGDDQFVDYRASEQNGQRTDFALVQRYPVAYPEGTQPVIAVHCAGSSWLGTLGAAHWVACDLRRPTHLGGTPIPCPPNIHDGSCLEALLEVTGDVADPHLWKPSRVAPRKLFVDGASWSLKEGCWESLRVVTLECEDGDPHRTVRILIDGKREPINARRGQFRLLVALAVLAQKSPDGCIDLAQLAADPWIWQNQPAPTEEELRHKLAMLRYLYLDEGLLVMARIDREVRFCAVVKIKAVEPVAAGVILGGDASPANDGKPHGRPRKAK
jgi:hypothetical protein